ncbi:fatty acyl-CoA reductase 1-like isoform X1 [Monomorium pharaonis]|uniref:fatty acyl-CoA reductase 1-like isoform X1 n=1 Tax=Monomorium pharaonis TaxID=307658 RepID=UPI0017479BFB|nr:fatty acyl-CoA reductase 1-like isoform X1 [Monomorium pharaonis]
MNKVTIDPAKSIPAFYAGQSIFLTGATGFLGKVFIEKVLRSCPDVREIFLLIRPAKGLDVNQRFKKMLNLPLFDKLREERPSSFKKLIPISGNVSEKVLGLSDENKQMLIDRVTIIIHGAASVKFNDSLKYAILNNTRSTRDICILAQNMKNIVALVYVSTAFTNVNEPFVEEKVYSPIVNWKKMIDMAESLDEHTLNVFMAKFLDYAPNTYIFSKNLAESIIQEYSFSLPCAIVRPSVVMSSIREPFPGWIDNYYGIISLYIGAGKGVIRVVYLNTSCHSNFVPVDIVVKAMLVVCWKLGLTTFTKDSNLFVLNCVNERRTTHRYDIDMCLSMLDEIPLDGTIWNNKSICTTNFILFYILTMLLHVMPATLIDRILTCFGRRPMAIRLVRLLYVVSCVTYYFSSNNWEYSNISKSFLTSLIPPEEQKMFSYDYSAYDIKEYYKNSIIGGKKFLLYEDLNRLDAARVRQKRVHLFSTVMENIIFFGVLWIIYKWIFL